MVIQNKTDVPLEVPLTKKSRLKVIVLEHMNENKGVENKRQALKRIRKRDESFDNSEHSCENSDENLERLSQVSENDLDELRTVYIKCKSVLKKIEQKYGHLININEKETSESRDCIDDQKCTCALNKKIIFDEDGKESTKEPDLASHICPKKMKREHSETKNIEIEYETPDMLPEDLQVLSNLLHNQNLEIANRHKIIYKIRGIRQEIINELKLNKHALVEKGKSNPDDVLDFKGTNLSALSGYPM